MARTDIFNKHFDLYDKDEIAHKLIGPALYIDEMNPTRPARLVMLLKAFADNKIASLFGLNIVEFMRLDSLEIELLLESAREVLDAKDAALASIKDEAEGLEETLMGGLE
jgi:hypothetical protein